MQLLISVAAGFGCRAAYLIIACLAVFVVLLLREVGMHLKSATRRRRFVEMGEFLPEEEIYLTKKQASEGGE